MFFCCNYTLLLDVERNDQIYPRPSLITEILSTDPIASWKLNKSEISTKTPPGKSIAWFAWQRDFPLFFTL